MKKKKNLITLIDFLTDKALEIIKKTGKLISNKNSHDTAFIFIKVAITFLFLVLLDIPFTLLENTGIWLIYQIGDSFRYILALSWKVVINCSYIILNLIILFKVFKDILNNKELNLIETDHRKDTKIKKSIFVPIIQIIKVVLYLSTAPFIIMIIILLIALGMNLALIVNGYFTYSILFIAIGLIIMLLSVVLAIIDITKRGVK